MQFTDLEIIKQALINKEKGIPFVMATIVESIGSSPGRSGFRMLIFQNGKSQGTIGGGGLEKVVIDESLEIHKNHENKLLSYELKEDANSLEMQCGGSAKVFLEYFPIIRTAYLFGAGHICHSILPILQSLKFRIVVIDNRENFVKDIAEKGIDEAIFSDYIKYSLNFTPNSEDTIIVFTHGHKHDLEIIDTICSRDIQVKYFGMIGSKIKSKNNLDVVREKKYKGNLVEKIFAPIGLNIAKTTKEEIVVAICAEILAVYNNIENITFMSKR